MLKVKELFESKYYSYGMLSIIYFYVFFSIEYASISEKIFLPFILVGTLPIFFFYKNKILKNSIFVVFVLILLVQILSWINSQIYIPEVANSIPTLDRLGKLFIFFFIAYWLNGNLKYIKFLWIFFIFGFIFASFMNVDIVNTINNALNGHRIDLGIKNAQYTGMFASVNLLMLSLYIPTIIKKYKEHKIALIMALLLIVFFVCVVLISQARQSWLGLIASFIIGSIGYIIVYKRGFVIVSIFGVLFSFAIVYIYNNSNMVHNRVLSEKRVFKEIVNANKNIEMSSIGIRVNSWIEATKWIKQHPFIGLDSVAIPEVIARSSVFNDNFKRQFKHLHNFFIETFVAYGLVGILLILAMYYLVIKSIYSSDLSKNDKKYYLFMAITILSYWFVVNNFETFDSRKYGILAHNIILASFYTFYLTKTLKR